MVGMASSRSGRKSLPSECFGVLGPNGAGKTTVMKILTGFLDATSGTVKVDGLEIGDHRTEVQQRIGYLPENAPLYEEMSVQAYLETIAALRGAKHTKHIFLRISCTFFGDFAISHVPFWSLPVCFIVDFADFAS